MSKILFAKLRSGVATGLLTAFLLTTGGAPFASAQKLRKADSIKDKSVFADSTAESVAPQVEPRVSAPDAVVFSNPTAIEIPDLVGAATPYPSTITVAGVVGTVTKVTVTLNQVNHTFPDDIGVLLVGPTGAKVRLMTDSGGDEDVINANLTFDDAAANFAPDDAAIVSGVYKPTQGTNIDAPGSNLHPADFPQPAPANPYSLALSSFNNQDPNGVWSLYVDDDSTGDDGMIAGGYSIDITTGGAPPQPVAAKPCYDFFGSGRTSFATVRRSDNGIIWDLRSNGGAETSLIQFGLNTDTPTPGYFDADNIADINVWRRGTANNTQATYYVRPSTAPNTFFGVQWGRNDGNPTEIINDIPGSEGDYDGDGRDDPMVIRPVGNDYVWYYLRSSNNTFAGVPFGYSITDMPLPGADYNGDGRHELAVIRIDNNGGDSYILGDSVTSAVVLGAQWGEYNTDYFVVGDYIGDSRADFAVWRGKGAEASGIWYILENGGGRVESYQWGISRDFSQPGVVDDLPVCGDYNGDGKQDVAIYRQATATFYWINSQTASGGNPPTVGIRQSGQRGDLPVGVLKTR